jgi:hypothetical protein
VRPLADGRRNPNPKPRLALLPPRPTKLAQPARAAPKPAKRGHAVISQAQMKALIFDCDGVILESEELHRVAYNAAFEHFKLQIGGHRQAVQNSICAQRQRPAAISSAARRLASGP